MLIKIVQAENDVKISLNASELLRRPKITRQLAATSSAVRGSGSYTISPITAGVHAVSIRRPT